MKTAQIHLQDDERRGVADCGCALDYDDDGNARLVMCPMHANAETALILLRQFYEADMAYQKSFTMNSIAIRKNRLKALFDVRDRTRRYLEQWKKEVENV